jgi:hypothetical protein
MNISANELPEPVAVDVTVSADALTVSLSDGRAISAPLAWYPRLAHGKPAERRRWQLIGKGQGIHWPDLDEDISVAALLRGRRSKESTASLKRWLGTRSRGS